jgi:inositol transport system permease protein
MNKRSGKKFNFALFYQRFGVVTLLVILFIVAALLSPNFINPRNLTNVLRQIVIITTIACGACFVMITAQINFAYDGLIAFLGCMSVLIMVNTDNVVLAVGGGLALGAGLGLVYGCCVTVLKVPGFIVGLALDSIVSGAIVIISGGVQIKGAGEAFEVLGKGYIGPVPINVIIMFAVIIICHIILTKSTFGRKVFAVGGNRQAAIASGIDADSVIRRAYIIDGLTVATAAILFMSRLGVGQPTAGEGYAFDGITGAVIGGCSIYGGKGSVVGCLVGAAIVGILDNILSLMNVSSYWQDVFSGAVVLVAVLVDMLTKDAATRAVKNMMADKKAA